MRRGIVLAAGAIAMLAMGWVWSARVEASDFGQMGEVFPIIETDLLATIENKLKTLEANGAIERLQAQMRDQAEASVRRPRPVAGMTPTVMKREWLFDPSAVLDKDVFDAKGNLIAKAGTRVNPLDFVTMRKNLVFVDGDDKAQVDWAVAHWPANKAKIVFVAGSPFDAMKPWQRRFYFDQGGRLTGHFGIEHVPAVVAPAGKALKVSEVPMGSKSS